MKAILSLLNPYVGNNEQTSDEIKEKYQLQDYQLIQYQILQSDIVTIVW